MGAGGFAPFPSLFADLLIGTLSPNFFFSVKLLVVYPQTFYRLESLVPNATPPPLSPFVPPPSSILTRLFTKQPPFSIFVSFWAILDM